MAAKKSAAKKTKPAKARKAKAKVQRKAKVEPAAVSPAQMEKRPPGRPCEFSQATANEICARLADGESLRSICGGEHMPARKTVFQWIFRFPEFGNQYAQARQVQAEAMAEELLEIADDGTNDWMERKGEDGQAIGWQLNGEHVQRSRLRLDTRKWVASKLLPKKYGDRVEVDANVGFRGLTDEQLDRKFAEVVASAIAATAKGTKARAG